MSAGSWSVAEGTFGRPPGDEQAAFDDAAIDDLRVLGEPVDGVELVEFELVPDRATGRRTGEHYRGPGPRRHALTRTHRRPGVSYELLPHPADVRFRATGATLDAAFAEAVRAFADIAESHGGTDVRREVRVESEDRQALLFDFLARLVLLQEIDEVAVTRADTLRITAVDGGYALDAVVLCGPIEGTLFDVKSPTYSEMRVEETEGEWVLEATLDI